MIKIPEGFLVVNAISPATNGAELTGDYISLKLAHRAWVVVQMTQANAAQATISLSKATAVDGSGATAVTATLPIWSNLDVSASDLLVRRTDAASYQLDAAVKNKLVVIQIDPGAIGAYDCIAVVVGVSNVANIASALYVIDPRIAEGQNQPSVIVD